MKYMRAARIALVVVTSLLLVPVAFLCLAYMRAARAALVVMALLLLLLATFFYLVYRPWAMNWGATEEEILRPLGGDKIIADATFDATRAVTIDAEPEEVWPWLLQMGYKRAGFYSYDFLDNDGIPSAKTILPEYQGLKVGDMVPLSASESARVTALKPNSHLLLIFKQDVFSWAWGLYPTAEGGTRLVCRLRWRAGGMRTQLMLEAFEIIMMREHLLGLKHRAEALAARGSSVSPA